MTGDRSSHASAVLAAALIMGVTLLLPASAQALCLYLDVSGSWSIRQTNGPLAQMQLQQTGSSIQGTGFYSGNNRVLIHGKLEGTVGPDWVKFRVHWENGAVGQYEGKLEYNRKDDESSVTQETFSGTTFDEAHPDEKSYWFYPRQHFDCATDDGAKVGNLNFGIPPPPEQPKALGRTQAPPKLGPVSRPAGPVAALPLYTPTSPKTSICALAAAARARHASDAPDLEAQCRTLSGRP